MADVYEIAVGRKTNNGFFTTTVLTIIDGEGDDDKWYTDMVSSVWHFGDGSGTWFIKPGNKELQICDRNGGRIEASLYFDRWPLRTGDTGKVEHYIQFAHKDLWFITRVVE